MALKAGSKAPDFIAESIGGEKITSKSLTGKFLVLYFYPKDDTSGCTKEACDFRDNIMRITTLGASVLGVSPDGTDSHEKFINKFLLNFKLLSDSDKNICSKYGVWVEKSMYGRKYMGVERTTFIINPEGFIEHVFEKVKVQGHVDEVIEKLGEIIQRPR